MGGQYGRLISANEYKADTHVYTRWTGHKNAPKQMSPELVNTKNKAKVSVS